MNTKEKNIQTPTIHLMTWFCWEAMCLLSSRKIWLPSKCCLECKIYQQLNQHKVSQFNVINQNNLKKALVDVEGAISIQLISHWSITRMMCPVRHAFVLSDTQNVSDRTKQILNFPSGVLYFFKKTLLILFYTISAKRKILLLFISHLVWKQIKLFADESCRTGHVTPVK